MPDNTPAPVTKPVTPPFAYGTETSEPYIPDPTKNTFDILMYDIVPKLAGNRATVGEREYFDRNRPAHWEPASAWDTKPASENAPEPKQDDTAPTPAQTPAAFTPSFEPLALAATSDADSAKIIDAIGQIEDRLEQFAREVFDQERSRLRAANVADADAAAMQLAEKQRKERRAAVYAEQEPKLLKSIAALQQRESEIVKQAAVYDCVDQPNAATFATIESIGSNERGQYAAQIAGLGAASLRALAELARSTSNLPLASAVFAENQRIEKSQRLFSNDQFAQKLWGTKAKELHQAVVVSRQATNQALSYLRSLKSGNPDSLGKISRGVAKVAAKYNANPTEPPETPLDSSNHSLSRISRGLRALANAESGDE